MPALNSVGVACVKYFCDMRSYVARTLHKSDPCIPTDTRSHMYCGRSTVAPFVRIKYERSSVLNPK